ncbi:hypothetical protein EDB81DRAFT_231036 [Dactylonectria macrodidyma]|uniref:Uncharacterized protein n=1 Tax=Dactylonectria macrodidyma TaxID=307937 RepID=A0A9P9DJ73_9HYPO|nr:hypothetical protein EDB81DRAFT_231036 [Dactylonectria macrodidyma]
MSHRPVFGACIGVAIPAASATKLRFDCGPGPACFVPSALLRGYAFEEGPRKGGTKTATIKTVALRKVLTKTGFDKD